jgi:predicted TIM-barrel fold metal-dependent hydrolase
VPSQQPELAAREIDRLGDHPGFVQVFLPVRSEALYGNRRYHPIFAAAARHGLVVGVHFGGSPGNPPTPSGWPSYYLEEYVDMATIFESQVLSMIAEGLFERFPALRVSLLEGGFTWLPAWLWRIDKEWKGLRREIPWSRRLPSETVREHARLTIQPVDAPPEPRHLLEIIDALGDERMLLYASDYPHVHAAPDRPPAEDWTLAEAALGARLPNGLARKIMGENARGWYRNLPAAKEAAPWS